MTTATNLAAQWNRVWAQWDTNVSSAGVGDLLFLRSAAKHSLGHAVAVLEATTVLRGWGLGLGVVPHRLSGYYRDNPDEALRLLDTVGLLSDCPVDTLLAWSTMLQDVPSK